MIHAIAQSSDKKNANGEPIPDMQGAWVTLCEGKRTPDPAIEVSGNYEDVTCPSCATRLLAMG